MTTQPHTPHTGEPEQTDAPIVVHLSAMDRMLPLWILLAMILGLVLGRLVPGLNDALNAVKVGQTSLLIALVLLLIMYPVLAKVRYDEIGLLGICQVK